MSQVNEYYNLVEKVGKAGANALFPNEFEYYLVQFELTDSDGRSIDSLVFPVNPRSLEISEAYQNTVTKTAHGVVAYSNQTFNPYDITMSGTYGRSFKTLFVPQVRVRDLTETGLSQISPTFNASIKTGYGATKKLEGILKDAQKLDDKNKPKKLYFYCPIFNISAIVKVMNTSFDMSEGTNMMWNYSLSMKAIADANRMNFNVLKHAGQTDVSSILSTSSRIASDLHVELADFTDFINIV